MSQKEFIKTKYERLKKVLIYIKKQFDIFSWQYLFDS